MTEPLTINRGSHKLTVTPRDDGFSLTVSGGPNISKAEYAQIETFVADKPGAEAFLTKLQARMAR